MAELKVQGTCPKCSHVVNTTATKGRVTWRGTCPRRGCGGVVLARRIKDATAAVAPPGETEPAQQPAKKAAPRKVVKVSGYKRQPPGGNARVPDAVQPAPGSGPPAGGGAAGDAGGSGGGAGPAKLAVPAGEPETGHKRHPYADLGFNW